MGPVARLKELLERLLPWYNREQDDDRDRRIDAKLARVEQVHESLLRQSFRQQDDRFRGRR